MGLHVHDGPSGIFLGRGGANRFYFTEKEPGTPLKTKENISHKKFLQTDVSLCIYIIPNRLYT